MPFIPDSIFGISYMVAVFITATVALYKRKNLALAAVLVAHFITLRLIVAINHESAFLWCIHDVFLIAAASLTRTKHGFAVSACFIPVLLLDQFWLVFGSQFEANSAVAEACGYLAMFIIAGLGDDIGGYLDRRSNNFRISAGRFFTLFTLASRIKNERPAGNSDGGLAKRQKTTGESF